jgi:hypothetical protein
MMKKIVDAGYWWPTTNKDVNELCQTYDLCQRIGNLLTQNMAKFGVCLPFQLRFQTFIIPTRM